MLRCDISISGNSSYVNSCIQAAASPHAPPAVDGEVVLTFTVCCGLDGAQHQQVQLLGSQSLCELRDALYCVHDHLDFGAAAAEGCPDSFFFLEGVFFVDPRHRPTRDCTAGIRRWLATQWSTAENNERMASVADAARSLDLEETGASAAAEELVQSASTDPPPKITQCENTISHNAAGSMRTRARPAKLSTASLSELFGMRSGRGDDLQVRSMAATRCDAVPLQLATKYLFWHQSSCEHLLYLTDMHLHHSDADCGVAAPQYPLNTFLKQSVHRRCEVCDVTTAKYLVFGDRLAESSPCLFCE